MSRLRLALLGAAGVAVLLLLAVWQVPQWLDWTRYRATIEAFATATIGQPVTIRGPISLTLLPQPVLTAAQVDVGGNAPTELSVHVDALRLRVALWPLIGGRVDARELVLRGPDLRLPWPAEPDMLRRRPPAWLAAFSARIENGRLSIGRLALTNVDAALATLETGALSASGTAQFSGHDWHFTARLTAAGADGASGLNVTLDGQGKAVGLGASLSGQLSRDGALSGTFAGRGPNLAVLLPTPAVPFRADGRLTVGSGLAVIDDLALEIGGSPASGAVALRIAPNQRLDIALSASRLDLDAWLPVLLSSGTTIAGIDMPIGIDFSAEAAPLGSGTLEHVRAAFELQGGNLIVREANARLPGNGELRLSGRVARSDPTHPSFEGDARLTAPVLRTTLRWLEEAMPKALPPRLLAWLPASVAQRAELSAHVTADSGGTVLRRLTGTLDDVPVSGSIGLRRSDPPTLATDISLDRLAIDPWLPPRLPSLVELSKSASGLDTELRLNVRQATLAGTTIDRLSVDAAVEAGSILLRRLEGTARGVHVVASGMLTGGKVDDGKLSMETADAMRVADLLPAAWRATPALWRGPAKVEVQAAGTQEALALNLRLMLADAYLDASPTFNLKTGEWSGPLTLRHPGARRLVSTLGLGGEVGLRDLPSWLGDGSLSLVARLSGGRTRLSAESFDLTAAALHARGDLSLDRRTAEPRVSGHIAVDTVAMSLPSARSDLPLPFGFLHGWNGDLQIGISSLTIGGAPALSDASAMLSVMNGRLRIEPFAAKLGAGTVSGKFAIDAAADPPTVSAQVKANDVIITGPLVDAPVDLAAGRVDASAQFDARGFSPSTIVATLGGRIALSVSDGVAEGFDLHRLKLAAEKPDPKSTEAAAKQALSSGATGFDRLDLVANVAHGDVALDTGRLTGAAGEAHISGGINLATQALDISIGLQPALPAPPEVTLHLTGPIDRLARTPELAGLARWMAELVH